MTDTAKPKPKPDEDPFVFHDVNGDVIPTSHFDKGDPPMGFDWSGYAPVQHVMARIAAFRKNKPKR